MSIFTKARELIENDAVRLATDTENAWYFEVSVGEKKYEVRIEKNLVRVSPCSCRFGIYKGIKGYLCSHQIACLIWLYERNNANIKISEHGFQDHKNYTCKRC